MRGFISIQNNDIECFRWCLVIYNPVTKNPAKIRDLNRELEKQHNFKNMRIPVHKRRLYKTSNSEENFR